MSWCVFSQDKSVSLKIEGNIAGHAAPSTNYWPSKDSYLLSAHIYIYVCVSVYRTLFTDQLTSRS